MTGRRVLRLSFHAITPTCRGIKGTNASLIAFWSWSFQSAIFLIPPHVHHRVASGCNAPTETPRVVMPEVPWHQLLGVAKSFLSFWKLLRSCFLVIAMLLLL